MTRPNASSSPEPEEVVSHYASGYEAHRLESEAGKLDRERSRELLKRFLPPAPATILDVGGGPGGHACWLAKLGYEVHLIDIVPLHVELAKKASAAQPEAPLASVAIWDARSLAWEEEQVDGLLLFGPLYHLTERTDRLQALREAHRVLRKSGIVMAVGISRFASALDGLRSGFLADPRFAAIVEQDLKNGQHRNRTGKPEYFMDTFFHHPDELRSEVMEAGFDLIGVYGVEGPCWLLRDFDEWWNDNERRNRLLQIARTVETEASLLGASAHLIAVGRKPEAEDRTTTGSRRRGHASA
jgi:ubiquinone/menaquinone biosynthesis C-methylase UbiE